MKDIPVFDTPYGVASLSLREIPYRQRAYITLQASLEPEKLLEECVGFCRACGAEKIFATGDSWLERYPLETVILRMQREKREFQQDACLFPVTESTLKQWLDIYNERMKDVPNASYMDSHDGKGMLASGDGYFVHRKGELLGIGKASGEKIDAVASIVPGMGETVMMALMSLLTGETVCLTVADTNTRAVRLYQRMGFLPVQELTRWYRVR